MSTSAGFELRQIPMTLAFARKRRERLLSACGLEAGHADYAVGMYDCDDNLLATASLDGDTIKGVAVDDSVRSEQLTPRMITALLEHAASEGIDNPKVFTKPEYGPVFSSLSFTRVGAGSRAILLEHNPHSLSDYKAYLASQPRREGVTGCIVMNANPMTRGHLYLIEQAAQRCDTLFVIPVADTFDSEYSYAERLAIMRRATADMPRVTVLEGSHYAVSRQSFPSYFIKEVGAYTDAHIELDLDIFATHIAPSLGATVRFAGSEPTDRLTARYNELMQTILPSRGIRVEVIDRIEDAGEPISASRVRAMVAQGHASHALTLVPDATVPYLLAHAAAKALTDELDTTPKPGLVDRENSGAHTDMDHSLMSRSIAALTPVFARIAIASQGRSLPSAGTLMGIGLDGERLMMEATGGVNAHRGALFSLGLAVSAAAWLTHNGHTLTRPALQGCIMQLAEGFVHPDGTHGARVADEYDVPTALDYARRGYPEAFDTDLSHGPHMALLSLMTRIEDSNVYHRGGRQGARDVKAMAAELMADYSDAGMRQLDATLTARNISPGGAADMLALAMLISSLTGTISEKDKITNPNKK